MRQGVHRRAYIWYYSCLALPRRATGIRNDLAEVLMMGGLFRHRDPKGRTDDIAGYSSRSDCLWIRPYLLSDFWLKTAGRESLGRFLYESDALHLRLQAFASTRDFQRWESSYRELAVRELSDSEHVTMKKIVGPRAPRRLPYCGVVLVGSDERGIVRIGIRRATTYPLSSTEIGQRLRWHPNVVVPVNDLRVSFSRPMPDNVERWEGGYYFGFTHEAQQRLRTAIARVAELRGISERHVIVEDNAFNIPNRLCESLRLRNGGAGSNSEFKVIVGTLARYQDLEVAIYEALDRMRNVRHVQILALAREQLPPPGFDHEPIAVSTDPSSGGYII